MSNQRMLLHINKKMGQSGSETYLVGGGGILDVNVDGLVDQGAGEGQPGGCIDNNLRRSLTNTE